MEILAAKKLSDTDLTAALYKAIASERSHVADSIACLIEITARDLHTRLGASSLFVYLTRDLKLSESSASKRCAAVRAIRQFPEMLGLVQSSRLHLSNIALISRHLTRENSVRLIAMAQMETQRGVEKKLALEFPQPAKRDTIRPVVYLARGGDVHAQPQPQLQGLVQVKSQVEGLAHDKGSDGPDFVFERGPSSGSESEIELGSADAEAALGIRLQVTLDPNAAADFEYLVAAMPGKSASAILALAVSELRKRRELGAGKSPSARPAKCSIGPKANSDILDAAPVTTAASRTPKPRAPMATRYIPAALRRDVARRDGQRCTYVAFAESRSDGARRCDAIHQLEFDHVNPRAFGGQNTLGNLCLLCRAHNNLAAKDLMGKEFIESRYGHG